MKIRQLIGRRIRISGRLHENQSQEPSHLHLSVEKKLLVSSGNISKNRIAVQNVLKRFTFWKFSPKFSANLRRTLNKIFENWFEMNNFK